MSTTEAWTREPQRGPRPSTLTPTAPDLDVAARSPVAVRNDGGRLGPISAATVLRLHPLVGNLAVQRLVRDPVVGGPVSIQRGNGLDDVVASVTLEADLATIATMLPTWDSNLRRQVATHLGVDRLKAMIHSLGESTITAIGPAALLAVGSLADVGRMPSVTAKNVRDLARRWKVPLSELLGALLVSGPVTVGDLLPLIEAATPAQRETAAQDAALMTQAKATLGRDSYLDLLPALRTYAARGPNPLPGDAASKYTSHMKGPEGDQHIRTVIAATVAGAVKAGRKMEGEISVVGDADFQDAFNRQWVDTGLYAVGTIARNTCSAFVDVNLPKRHIWVHKDLGNVGTVIHEGMHKYADPTLRDEQIARFPGTSGISQLDEGITEFFAREVNTTLGISRTNYQSQFETVEHLVARVGRGAVAKAYFDGAFAALKTAHATANGDPAKWDLFAKAIEKRQWALAQGHL